MHLNHSITKYKGQSYKSYSIAESYRDGKTVRKKTIWNLGKLTDKQAAQIRLICKVVKGKEQVLTQLKDIAVKETKAYLDIAVVNELWNQWQLDKAFDYGVTKSQLPTHTIARILTINRCTDPCSHYSIPKWATKNALEDVLKINLSGLNDDKIYFELDKIHQNKISIENYLFEHTHEKKPDSYKFINYDLSTSYFVGYRCDLSAFGKGKAECHGRRQVVLGVLINDEGYPFKWDVFPGNTAEVKTLKRNINACKYRFKLNDKGITLVFDRGIISNENADYIEDAEMKYISALDKDQIPTSGISLKPFTTIYLDEDNGKDKTKIKTPEGFKKYDNDLFFRDSGVIGNKRHVVGFNPTLFIEERKNRKEKIEFFEEFLRKENDNLKNAKKERKYDPTRSRTIAELKRLKIRKYFESPILKPITVERELVNGETQLVKTFQVQVAKKENIVEAEKLLDGVCVFVTNHVEKKGRGFKLKPKAIINAYRNKTKIEDVFKNVKSFLKIRPFFVNTDNHVKAVYSVCMLAYFINKYLANQRKMICEKDFLNSKQLYAPFKDIDIALLEDSNTGQVVKRSVELPYDTKELLNKLGMTHLVYTED